MKRWPPPFPLDPDLYDSPIHLFVRLLAYMAAEEGEEEGADDPDDAAEEAPMDEEQTPTAGTQAQREHIDFCQERAEVYLQRGDRAGAWSSFCSDLQKMPGGLGRAEKEMLLLGMQRMMQGQMQTVNEIRRFIWSFSDDR